MNAAQFKERMDWARRLTSPACLICTKSFAPSEPVIVVHVDGIDRDVYFHAACYDIILDQHRNAYKLMVRILMGDTDWVKGTIQINKLYPLRWFAPSRLTWRSVQQ